MTTSRTNEEIDEFSQHLAKLRQADWLDQSRQWWPACLFHCTDISNAVNILRRGELLSRVQAEQNGLLSVDIASKEVISQTDPRWKDYVRFYFRPRTPTQYRNEGFRPPSQQELDSHCPVPVYLIFYSLPLLSQIDSLFSDGNAGASGAMPSGEIEFFKKIPFDLVYHDSRFAPPDRSTIIYHRNAEVLLPKRVGLENICFIGCRSPAEYKSLLHLLPPGVRSNWVDKMGVRPNLQLFNRNWTFVEQVDMDDSQIIFRFNRTTTTPGPFDARVQITELATGNKFSWSNAQYQCNNVLELRLSQLRHPFDYTIHLTLDNNLAYANRYQADDLPF